jgi:hypothetical protein
VSRPRRPGRIEPARGHDDRVGRASRPRRWAPEGLSDSSCYIGGPSRCNPSGDLRRPIARWCGSATVPGGLLGCGSVRRCPSVEPVRLSGSRAMGMMSCSPSSNCPGQIPGFAVGLPNTAVGRSSKRLERGSVKPGRSFGECRRGRSGCAAGSKGWVRFHALIRALAAWERFAAQTPKPARF